MLKSPSAQNLGGGKIDPLIGVEAQLFVGVDGVEAAVLQLISPQFVDQADAAALLRQVHQDSGAGGGDFLDRALKLVATVAPQGPQQIAGETLRMQAGQHRFVLIGLTDNDGQVLQAAVNGPKGDDAGVLGVGQGNPGRTNGAQRPRLGAVILKDIAGIDQQQVMARRPGGQIVGGGIGDFRGHRRGQQPGDLGQRHGGAFAVISRRLLDGDGQRRLVFFRQRIIGNGIGKITDQVRRQRLGGGQGDDLADRFGQPQHRGTARRDRQYRGCLTDRAQLTKGIRRDRFGSQNQDGDAAATANGNQPPTPEFRHGAVNRQQGNRVPGCGHRQKLELFFAHNLTNTTFFVFRGGL